MIRTWIWLALGAVLGFTAPAQAAPACARACLGRLLDGYLSAMVAHDPHRAALDFTFRETFHSASSTLPAFTCSLRAATAVSPPPRISVPK